MKKYLLKSIIIIFLILIMIPTMKYAANEPKITLNKSSVEVEQGAEVQLKATVKNTKNAVLWGSSNKDIASVDKNGKITGKQIGKVTITAKIKGTNAQAKCTVKVIRPTKIIFSEHTINLDLSNNKEREVQLKLNSEKNKDLNLKYLNLEWLSTNTTMASVDENGKVTGKDVGTVLITAKIKGTNTIAQCRVNVNRIGVPSTAINERAGAYLSEINVPVTENIEKVLRHKYNKNNYLKTQGMTRVTVNNQTYTLLTTITKNSSENYRTNTSIYILKEDGEVAAHVRDYCFGHANAMCSDDKYIYIISGGSETEYLKNGKKVKYTGKQLYVLDKDAYVNRAIKEYNKIKNNKNIKNKYVTQGVTIEDKKDKNNNLRIYVSPRTLGSIAYDRSRDKLYMSNNYNLYEIIRKNGEITLGKDGKIKMKFVAYFSHTTEQVDDYERLFNTTNAGLAFVGDYLLVGRHLKYGFGSKAEITNTIVVYKCVFKDGAIERNNITYKGTYLLAKEKNIEKEIEDIEVVDNACIAVSYDIWDKIIEESSDPDERVYENRDDAVYKYDISVFNTTKIKIKYNGKVAGKNDVEATLYDKNGARLGVYKTTNSGNIWIEGLDTYCENYTLKITSAKGSFKNLETKKMYFNFKDHKYNYSPYRTITFKENTTITE